MSDAPPPRPPPPPRCRPVTAPPPCGSCGACARRGFGPRSRGGPRLRAAAVGRRGPPRADRRDLRLRGSQGITHPDPGRLVVLQALTGAGRLRTMGALPR
ncbi:hypothetical protein SBRY_30168 [Actinacidiphila bryophytorum]|uniref:Uncharacterized protein n=1 Tax=Actinacidiphila bryophytorum TaxID=1436133 RepID=A0A9W4MAZ6_9ACTN|nr:hypothetical protein SBRY_30168 [Actinacidiphila bryophytorum]